MSASVVRGNATLTVEEAQTKGKKRKAEEIDKTIQLVAGADVTLKVGQGEDALDIKVSGAVLSVASKVFAAMLNSSFIEGIPKVIELNQDDPQVVLHFCHIIHHQCGSIKGVDRKRLREITIFADLRGCEDAVRSWIMLAIDDHRAWAKSIAKDPTSLQTFPTSITELVPEDLMAIAYVFDLPDLFWETTIAFAASSIPPFRNIDTFINIDTEFGGFFVWIRPLCSRQAQWLFEKILKCIGPHPNVGRGSCRCPQLNDSYKSNHTKLGSLLFRFSHEGLYPTDPASCTKSWAQAMACISEIIAELDEDTKSFAASALTESADKPSIELGCCTGCSSCARDLKAELQALSFAEKREFRRRGHCLKCLKKGDIGHTNLDGRCPFHGILSDLTSERVARESPLEECDSNLIFALGQVSPLARRTIVALKSSPQSSEGVHVQMIASAMGISTAEVYGGAEELVAQGLIFTTVDDDTWASAGR